MLPPKGTVASADEIKARWAYSELISPRFRKFYAMPGLDEVEALAKAAAPFETLRPDQRDYLAACVGTTRQMLMHYLNPHFSFELQGWSKGRLCQAFAMPIFDTPARKAVLPFYDFLIRERDRRPDGILDPSDPRVAVDGIAAEPDRPLSAAPIAVSLFPHTIVDGYLRCLLFMRDAPATAELPVWVGLRFSAG